MKPKSTAMVVTGSAAQVPKNSASQLNIEVIPLGVIIDGREYQDGVNLTPGELYQKMRSGNVEVKTTAPSVGQYYACFKKIAEKGSKEILCITLSSKLSSDYSQAVDAANLLKTENPDCKVVVYDSLSAAVPQGLLVIEAAQRLIAGESLESVIEFLDSARRRAGFMAALDSLDYLSRGGRIGKAAYLLGSALHIIPVLSLNEEGIVAPAAILRQKGKVLPTLLSTLQKKTSGYQKIQVAVMHADALDEAKTLQQLVQQAFPGVDVPIEEFTPVMGAHAGPGLIGLGYYYE